MAGNPRSAAQKARQLAAVAAAVYGSSGRDVIRLPLEPDHPLVSVLRNALNRAEVQPSNTLLPEPNLSRVQQRRRHPSPLELGRPLVLMLHALSRAMVAPRMNC